MSYITCFKISRYLLYTLLYKNISEKYKLIIDKNES